MKTTNPDDSAPQHVSDARDRWRPRTDVIALGVLGILAGLMWVVSVGRLVVDDAYISFRYGRNLCEGHGLLFNPGEPPVEGFSNLLWTLLVAPLTCLSEDPIHVVRLIGWLLLAVTLLYSARLVVRTTSSTAAGVATAALLLSSPSFMAWHFAGLETPLVACLAVVGLAMIDDERHPAWHAGLALSALGITRIDAPLLVAIVILGWAIGRLRDPGQLPATAKRAAMVTALAAGTWALALLGRRMWFGEWLPNTFHAKVSTSDESTINGLRYMASAVVTQPWLALVPLAMGVAVWRSKRRSLSVPIAATTAVHCLYITTVGGDWMPLNRFIVPVLPFAAILVALGARAGLRKAFTPALLLLVAVSIPVSVCVVGSESIRRDVLNATLNTEFGRSTGLHLGLTLAPDAGFATTAAGAAPYFSRLRTIDMVGLNDHHIARTEGPRIGLGLKPGHTKGDGAYILDRGPDAILFTWGRTQRPQLLISDAMIVFDPRFYAEYAHRSADIPIQIRPIPVPHLPGAHIGSFGEFECSSGWLFDRCAPPPSSPLHVWQRAPERAVTTPVGALARRVNDADVSTGARAALNELDSVRPALEALGFGVIADAYEARFSIESRDFDRVSRAIAQGARRPQFDGTLFQFWIASDPLFEGVVDFGPTPSP